MRKLTILALAAAMLWGCAPKASPVSWTPVGGSRADATVTLGCIYNPAIETPTAAQDLLALARQRCQSWGYNDAEAFGEKMQRCLAREFGPFGLSRCVEMQATQIYQCLGRGDGRVEADK